MAPGGRRAADHDQEAYRTWLVLEWAGPWERMLDWLTPAGPHKAPAARWLIRRDDAWRDRYAARREEPPARWRRRP